jgi:hypothetical protein
MKILLYNLIRGYCLIVPYRSGIVYENQTGGLSVYPESLEGVLVPLDDWDIDPEGDKSAFDRIAQITVDADSLTHYAADAIDAVLADSRYAMSRYQATVDRTRLQDSREAWLWLNITAENVGLTEGLKFDKAVLTWQNSD